MLKLKSIVCASVVFSMLTAILVSCDKSGDTGTGQTSAGDGVDEFSYKADYLPAADYGGYEFRIAAYAEEDGTLRTSADKDSEIGEVVNDALYNRNRLIESRYNIKIREITMANGTFSLDYFTKSVRSGMDEFDLCQLVISQAFSAALDGLITPVSDLPYVDTTQPWYARKLNDALSMGGKLYFAYSDECLNMFEQANVVCFNKNMARNFDL